MSSPPSTARTPAAAIGRIVRAVSVFVAGFLALYFCDSTTRLFVKHALVFDSMFFGGPALAGAFALTFVALICAAAYLRGLWLAGGVLSAFLMILVAECSFRITGVPLNSFQVGLFFEANGSAWDVVGQYGRQISDAAAHISWIFLLGVAAIRVLRWRPPGALFFSTLIGALALLEIARPEFEGQLLVPSPLGLPAAAVATLSESHYLPRGVVTLPFKGATRVRHLIYVVDETIRADAISLNDRERGATPWLASFPDLINFGAAVSAANCSVQAQYILRTGLTPEQVPDTERKTLSQPNILGYATASGRKTYFLNAQSPELTGYMSKYDVTGVQTEVGVYDDIDACKHSGECRLVSRLKEIAAGNEHTFTYVVKAAAHWPYEVRYPAREAFFQPDPAPGHREPERIVNSYRNAIRWNVDLFFRELLGEQGLKDYLIIYTGDHGEDLTPGRGRSPHCGHDNKVTPIEGVVPILLFTDHPELKEKFAHLAEYRLNRTSQFDLFPSWLVLFGYEPTEVSRRFGASLFEPTLRKMEFYWGDIFHNYGGFVRGR